MNDFTAWIQSNWYSLGKSPQSVCLPRCWCLVCAAHPQDNATVPGAGRSAPKTVSHWRDHRPPLLECRLRAPLREREPLLAHAHRTPSSHSARAPRNRPEPMVSCPPQSRSRPPQPDGVVANTHEQRRLRSLAQSPPLAPVPSPQLTAPRRFPIDAMVRNSVRKGFRRGSGRRLSNHDSLDVQTL